MIGTIFGGVCTAFFCGFLVDSLRNIWAPVVQVVKAI
jgi:hypothetical protein